MIYKVKDVSVKYEDGNSIVFAIKNINMEVIKGETIAIIGASGAGKSTLLHVLSGIEKPTGGELLYEDIDMSAMSSGKLAQMRLEEFGFVFQNFYLIPTMSVRDNIWLPAIMADGKVDQEFYEDIICELEIKDKEGMYPEQLSGGEKQRVAIARGLINKPNVIFADEPTGNLDSINGNKVFQIIFECAQKYHQTLIYVTHDLEKAKLAQRSILLKDGVIVEET